VTGQEPLTVNVSLYGVVRDVVKETSVTVCVGGGASVRDILGRLTDACGPRLGERLLDGAGEVRKNVRVFLDDELVTSADVKLDTGGPSLRRREVRVIVLAAAAGG